MITDKIIWPKHYNPAEADYTVEAEILADGLTAEDVWPYLSNISDISKVDNQFVYAVPENSSVDDPHMFRHEKFTLSTDDYKADVEVVESVPPKGDRTGKLSWSGDAALTKSGEKFTFMHMWILDVESGDKLKIVSVLAVKGKVFNQEYFASVNQRYLTDIVAYARGKKTHTNHPARH